MNQSENEKKMLTDLVASQDLEPIDGQPESEMTIGDLKRDANTFCRRFSDAADAINYNGQNQQHVDV